MAATPTYAMDTATITSVTDLLSSFAGTALLVIVAGIAIIGIPAVTMYAVRFLWGFVRGHLHG